MKIKLHHQYRTVLGYTATPTIYDPETRLFSGNIRTPNLGIFREEGSWNEYGESHTNFMNTLGITRKVAALPEHVVNQIFDLNYANKHIQALEAFEDAWDAYREPVIHRRMEIAALIIIVAMIVATIIVCGQ